jgi:hypothetical protein
MHTIVQNKLRPPIDTEKEERDELSKKDTKKKDRVVVYIRRGDILSPCLRSHSSRYLANSYYLGLLIKCSTT